MPSASELAASPAEWQPTRSPRCALLQRKGSARAQCQQGLVCVRDPRSAMFCVRREFLERCFAFDEKVSVFQCSAAHRSCDPCAWTDLPVLRRVAPIGEWRLLPTVHEILGLSHRRLSPALRESWNTTASSSSSSGSSSRRHASTRVRQQQPLQQQDSSGR